MVTKGERTRNKITSTSKELFLSNGFTATSMRDIANATGLSPGSLYNHFKGKDELFEAVLQDISPIDEFIDHLNMESNHEPESFLTTSIKTLVTLLMQHQDYIRLGLIDAQERGGKAIQSIPPKMFPIFHGTMTKISVLDSSGRLRDIPVEAILRTVVSLVIGYVATEVVAKPMNSLMLPDLDYVEAMVEILLHGILKEAA